MSIRRALAFGVCAVAIAAAGGGCIGGSDSGTEAPDSSKIATATLPAELPEPRIINESVVQADGSASTYVIKSGDTFAGVAERFGVSLEDLVAANPGVDASNLSVGQSIRLPDDVEAQPPEEEPTPAAEESTPAAEATEAPPPEAPPTEPPPTEPPPPAGTPTPSPLGQTYTVQSGDIPVTIAEQFGITVEALLTANPGLDPTGLVVGQVIVIPPAPTAPAP